MTQVSKRQLGKRLETEIYEAFWSTIAKLTDKRDVELFFGDLFTRAERINFAKRLSIAILLHKGYDWRSIRDLLKVSEGTIAKIASKRETVGFRVFFYKLEKDERWRKFWQDLAKTYLVITHGDRIARLGDEGVERVYFPRKKKVLL